MYNLLSQYGANTSCSGEELSTSGVTPPQFDPQDLPRRPGVRAVAKYISLEELLQADIREAERKRNEADPDIRDSIHPPQRFVRFRLSDSFIDADILRSMTELDVDYNVGIVDMWMMILRRRLKNRQFVADGVNSANTILLDSEFFRKLQDDWTAFDNYQTQLFPSDAEAHNRNTVDTLRTYIPRQDVSGYVFAVGVGSTHVPWWNAMRVIVPCLLNGHFVICVVSTTTGICVLYDPIWHRLKPTAKKVRQEQMIPLLRLFTRILEATGWYQRTTLDYSEARNNFILKLAVATRTAQFTQLDDTSCGAFICMHAERFISGRPSIEWGNNYHFEYRRIMATKLYELSDLVELPREDEEENDN